MRRIPIPRQKTDEQGRKLCRWCETPVPKGRRTFCSAECVHEAMLRSDPGYLRAQTKKRDKGVCAGCGTDTEAIKLRYLQIANISHKGINAYQALLKQMTTRWGITDSRWWKITNSPSRAEVLASNEAEYRYQVKAYEGIKARHESAGQPFTRPHPDTYLPDKLAKRLELAVELTDQETRVVEIDKRLRKLATARRKRIAAELERDGFKGSTSPYKLSNLWQADHIHPVAHGGGGCGLDNIQTLCTKCHKAKTADQARRAALIRRGIDPDAPPEPDPQLTLL